MSEAIRPKLPDRDAALGRQVGRPGNADPSRPVERSDVARYIAEICSEMTAMAEAAQHPMLAYLLGMARQEADRLARSGRTGL